MSKTYKTILFERDERGIATVQINRPKKLNALNDEVLNELTGVFQAIQIDEEITAVIMTGSGEKAFVAGADIKELRELNKRSARMASQKGQQIFQMIEDTRVPVIAAVNGYALGGGAELAMACHLRIAGKNAVFGLPEVGLGLIPGYGGTQRLAQIVGRARALEMILTGKQVNADEAHQMGLVNEVMDGNAVDAARKLAEKILKNGPVAIQSAIKAVYHSDHQKGYQIEADLFGRLFETEDVVEGTSAFLEKRKPEFKGK
jgi:enoyl-CoA hydratase